jgi:LemA protein
MLKKVLIPVILIGFVFFWGVGANNTLVEQEENVRQAWSQVENQYQRRADLIPNLVNTVKGAANFEQETLTAVIEARSKATSINLDASDLNSQQALDQFKQAQGQLSSALSRLMVTVERYPELKANSNFMDLQHQLEGTENRIATERMRYNQSVQSFNTDIRQFPTSFIAGVLGFEQKAYFEADEGAQEAPTVDFN